MKKDLTVRSWWFAIHNPFLSKGGFKNHEFYYEMYKRVQRMNPEEILIYQKHRPLYEMMYMLFEMGWVEFDIEQVFIDGDFIESHINFKTQEITLTDSRYPERSFVISDEEKKIIMDFYREYKNEFEYENQFNN